jgi:mannosyltransferase
MGDPITEAEGPRPADTMFVVGVVMIGAILRFLHLGAQSFWVDEALSLAFAQLPWPQFVHLTEARELNMLPYYLILRGWIHLGTAEWIVRSLSAICSVATLPLLYQLGVRLFGVRFGQIALSLLAVHPYHIRFAQEARGYSLMLLLVTASTLFFVRASEGSSRHSRRFWIAYVVTSALAAYAHFYASLALLAQWAAIVIVRPRGYPWKRFAIAVIAIGMLLVPLAAFVLLGHADPANWISVPTAKRVEYLVYSLLGGDNTHGARIVAWPIYVLVLIAAGAGARRAWRARGNGIDAQRYALIFAGAALPIVLVLAVSFFKPIFVDKYLMESLPFAVLLIAIGVTELRPRALSWGALLLALLLSAHGTVNYYRHPDKDDWRAATRYVLASAQPGDAALFFPRYVIAPFEYYRARFDSSAMSANSAKKVAIVYPGTFGEEDVGIAVSGVQHRYGRLWAVFNQDGDAGVALRDSLARHYPLVSDRQFTGVRVVLYDTR